MFKAVPDLMASALESGMPVEAALDGLSLGAVRLYLRSEIANPVSCHNIAAIWVALFKMSAIWLLTGGCAPHHRHRGTALPTGAPRGALHIQQRSFDKPLDHETVLDGCATVV